MEILWKTIGFPTIPRTTLCHVQVSPGCDLAVLKLSPTTTWRSEEQEQLLVEGFPPTLVFISFYKSTHNHLLRDTALNLPYPKMYVLGSGWTNN